MKGGQRTVLFGVIALAFLALGLHLCLDHAEAGKVIFASFATAVVAISLGVSAKHGIESLATGGGIEGAWKTLTSDQKPTGKAG